MEKNLKKPSSTSFFWVFLFSEVNSFVDNVYLNHAVVRRPRLRPASLWWLGRKYWKWENGGIDCKSFLLLHNPDQLAIELRCTACACSPNVLHIVQNRPWELSLFRFSNDLRFFWKLDSCLRKCLQRVGRQLRYTEISSSQSNVEDKHSYSCFCSCMYSYRAVWTALKREVQILRDHW